MSVQLTSPVELCPISPNTLLSIREALPYEVGRIDWPFSDRQQFPELTNELDFIAQTLKKAIEPRPTAVRFKVHKTDVLPGANQIDYGWHFDDHSLIVVDSLPTEYLHGSVNIRHFGRQLTSVDGDFEKMSKKVSWLDKLSEDELAEHGLHVRTLRPYTLNFLGRNCLHRSPINTSDQPVARTLVCADVKLAA